MTAEQVQLNGALVVLRHERESAIEGFAVEDTLRDGDRLAHAAGELAAAHTLKLDTSHHLAALETALRELEPLYDQFAGFTRSGTDAVAAIESLLWYAERFVIHLTSQGNHLPALEWGGIDLAALLRENPDGKPVIYVPFSRDAIAAYAMSALMRHLIGREFQIVLVATDTQKIGVAGVMAENAPAPPENRNDWAGHIFIDIDNSTDGTTKLAVLAALDWRFGT